MTRVEGNTRPTSLDGQDPIAEMMQRSAEPEAALAQLDSHLKRISDPKIRENLVRRAVAAVKNSSLGASAKTELLGALDQRDAQAGKDHVSANKDQAKHQANQRWLRDTVRPDRPHPTLLGNANLYTPRSVATLGRMSSYEVSQKFSDSKRQLGDAVWGKFASTMKDRIMTRIGDAQSAVRSLNASPANREKFWQALTTPAAREKELRSLGFSTGNAKRLAQSAHPDHQALSATLDRLDKALGKSLDRVSHLNPGVLAHDDAELFRTYGKEAEAVKQQLGIRPGSFGHDVLDRRLKAGNQAIRKDATIATVLGTAAGFGPGVITALVFGGISVAAQQGEVEAAQMAEALGLAKDGTTKAADAAATSAYWSAGIGLFTAGVGSRVVWGANKVAKAPSYRLTNADTWANHLVKRLDPFASTTAVQLGSNAANAAGNAGVGTYTLLQPSAKE